jgi:hypothetical protein
MHRYELLNSVIINLYRFLALLCTLEHLKKIKRRELFCDLLAV